MAGHLTFTACDDLADSYDAESPSLDHVFGLLLKSLDTACEAAKASSGNLEEDFAGIESLIADSESVRGGDGALTPALKKCREMCEARFHLGR